MLDLQEEKNIYLSNFLQFEKESAEGVPWLHRLRKSAMKRFTELGFPTTRDEDWKFTNVAPLAKIPFKAAVADENETPGIVQIERLAPGSDAGHRLVFVDGRFLPGLSTLQRVPAGVIVDSLANVLSTHPDWAEPHLAQYAQFQQYAFTALNTAFVNDGAFVMLPAGSDLQLPLHILYITTGSGEGSVTHPRNLFVCGPRSRATIVETYAGLADDVYFTNSVTEVVLGPEAHVNHCKLQRESGEAFHVATTQIHHARGSQFTSHYVGLGGTLVRNEVRAVLYDEGCECTLNGLYMAGDRQHMDNHTVIDHASPRCASHELYKGILDDHAHGVFNGKIFVHQDAQKTDAKQTNQTLLLSENAVINTKPQLEIYADDVKCTHGATVGQLQDEAIFYLRSRGIGQDEARGLLTFAFANDVIGRIPIEPVRAELESLVLASQVRTPGLKKGVQP